MEDYCSEQITLRERTDHTEHQEEDGHSDNCSPFVTCGSCSGFVLFSSEISFVEILAIEEKPKPHYKYLTVDYYCARIWQPPKIS